MADALGAQVGVNDVNLFALGDGAVGAFGLADVTVDAVIGDDQGDGPTLRSFRRDSAESAPH